MQSEIYVDFPSTEGFFVDAHGVDGLTVHSETGSPENRLYPSPGSYFVAGVALCTASTARTYCRKNGFPLPAKVICRVTENDESSNIEKIDFEIIAGPGFPQDRLDALTRAAGTCWVKKAWTIPPEFSATSRLDD
jgi:uncharacterized OsmC-like protein